MSSALSPSKANELILKSLGHIVIEESLQSNLGISFRMVVERRQTVDTYAKEMGLPRLPFPESVRGMQA